MAVTPAPGLASAVVSGGQTIQVANATVGGIIITNPASSSDQGIAVAEPLYVSPVGPAGTAASGTTFALQPGQSWAFPQGQTTQTWVNANTGGHKFSVVVY